MAFSVVQSSYTSFATSATSNTYQYPSAVVAGDALFCGVVVNDGGTTTNTLTVSDNVNGSWTQAAVSRENTTSDLSIFIFYCLNSGSGQPTLTITSSLSSAMYVQIAEVSGVAASGAADGSGIGNGSATGTMTTTSFTTTGADFVYGIAMPYFAVSSFSPWTQLQYDASNGDYSFYQVQGTAGAMSASIALSGSTKWWNIAIAAFLPPQVIAGRMSLLGCGR